MRPYLPIAILLGAISINACTPPAREADKTEEIPAATALQGVTYATPGEVDSLLAANMNGALGLFTVGESQDQAPYMVIARTAPGQVEVHEIYDDVAIVRSGHATFRSGTKVSGEQTERGTAPARDWFGGEIQDATERSLSPGDFLIIPAMQAHQYIPAPGETFTYWTIKVTRKR